MKLLSRVYGIPKNTLVEKEKFDLIIDASTETSST